MFAGTKGGRVGAVGWLLELGGRGRGSWLFAGTRVHVIGLPVTWRDPDVTVLYVSGSLHEFLAGIWTRPKLTSALDAVV